MERLASKAAPGGWEHGTARGAVSGLGRESSTTRRTAGGTERRGTVGGVV